MRWIGATLRYLLNINTIWGLMILIAIGASVAQHYLPTKTFIPAERVQSGDNILAIRLQLEDAEPRTYAHRLGGQSGEMHLPADVRTTQGSTADGPNDDEPTADGLNDDEPTADLPGVDGPRLVSLDRFDRGYVLAWDHPGYGTYTIEFNGERLRAGRLVTLASLTDAAFDYAGKGFDLALGLVASMVLLLGLMKVGEHAGIVRLAARVFHPIMRLLFPGVPREHPANGAILMNMTTTLLGLGNAATPFGLKAMQELNELNPHKDVATDSQVMLLAYNTAGFALLPTTLLAVRKSAGCSDPFEIIGTCMLTGATAMVVAVVAARLLAKLPFFSVQAAVAERTPDEEMNAALAEEAADEEARS